MSTLSRPALEVGHRGWLTASIMLATIMQEAAAERDAHLPIREAVAA